MSFSQQDRGDVTPLDESSVSTMFSMMIAMPDSGQQPPDLRAKLKNDIEDTTVGVALTVSDSFVEQNTLNAMKSLTHRPIKRLSPRLDTTQAVAGATDSTCNVGTSNDPSGQLNNKDIPDEILNIVGNVSPRLLESTEPIKPYGSRPSTMPAASALHASQVASQHTSQHTSQYQHLSQYVSLPSPQQKQRKVKKQTLLLSLPSASMMRQDSASFLIDNSARFEKPLKRNLSADSFSDFDLSMMSMSLADNMSGHGRGDSPKKSKISTTLSKSKYLEVTNSKKSSAVYFSKLRSESRNKDFVVKYPLKVKG